MGDYNSANRDLGDTINEKRVLGIIISGNIDLGLSSLGTGIWGDYNSGKRDLGVIISGNRDCEGLQSLGTWICGL